MTLDAITLQCVRDELRATLLGGRVQHVHHPDELGLALECYALGQRRWLYCSAQPQRARAHLVAERPGRISDRVSPLLLLLRKYVDAGRLEDVSQPPLERVLALRFAKRSPEGPLWQTALVVEMLGRHGNLILVDADGAVLDAARRVTPEMSRTRTILPRVRYDLPPAPERLDPRTVTGQLMASAAATQPPERPAREILVAEVGACSPLLAREIVFAAHHALDVPASGADWDALA